MSGGANISRRDAMLAGLSGGIAATISPYYAFARPAPLQHALDKAASSGRPLFLPAGIYQTGTLVLKSGAHIQGVPGRTILRSAGETIFQCSSASDIQLSGLTFEGGGIPLPACSALLSATNTDNLDISNCRFLNSGGDGVLLHETGGRIENCAFSAIAGIALESKDSAGLEISGNQIHDCGAGGIVISRTAPSAEHTIVRGNRIARIAAGIADSTEAGNGIAIIRAGAVKVERNRITDCAASAVRIDEGPGCQLIANSCARLGGVGLFVACGQGGAMIANNFVECAATGIWLGKAEAGARAEARARAGARQTIVRGNIVRNPFMRKTGEMHGNGICLEEGGTVSGNVIEGAPAYGILIREDEALPAPRNRPMTISGNVIRKSHIGIGVDGGGDERTSRGALRIANNTIDDARDGAIRALRTGIHRSKSQV